MNKKSIKFLLIIIILSLMISGCSGQNLSLKLGEGIEDLEIVNEKTEFEVGEPIYYIIESNNKFDTDSVDMVLYLEDDSGGFSPIDKLTMEINRDWDRFYNNNPIFIPQTGEYKLQARINSETSITKEFVVY